MNCEQVRNSMSGFADGSLSGILSQAINNHLKRCEGCAFVLDQEQLLIEQLGTSPVPEPRAEFFAQALRAARQHHTGQGAGAVSVRYACAAACFLLGVLLTLFFQGSGVGWLSKDNPLAPRAELTVSDREQLDIHLQLSVNKDINDAKLVIEVPSSLQIVGFEDVSVLEWQVALKRGKNILALPVRARRKVSEDEISYLVARVKTGTGQKDFDIKVTVTASEQARHKALLMLPSSEHSVAGARLS